MDTPSTPSTALRTSLPLLQPSKFSQFPRIIEKILKIDKKDKIRSPKLNLGTPDKLSKDLRVLVMDKIMENGGNLGDTS